MAPQETIEHPSKGAERSENGAYASISAGSWNKSDMHALTARMSDLSLPAIFGNVELIAQAPAIEATISIPPAPAIETSNSFKADYSAPNYIQGLEHAKNPEQYTRFYTQQKEAEHLAETSAGYGEPPADAANTHKKADRWNPSKSDLNPLDPSSWSKLQAYAGDVGRANHWSQEDNKNHPGKTFPQVNALRHALSSAYIAYHDSASAAIAGGLWHELQTGIVETSQGIPSSKKPQDIKTWKDHDIDINNNLAGTKIAQEILDKGGSWQDVENAVVDAIKHHLGKDGRIAQPTHQLHTFLGP